VQYRVASGAVLLYISFSLNARLGSTRPKNLKAGRQCSRWGGRQQSHLFWLNARLRSTQPKNLKAGGRFAADSPPIRRKNSTRTNTVDIYLRPHSRPHRRDILERPLIDKGRQAGQYSGAGESAFVARR
jgi:hypothetical protein